MHFVDIDIQYISCILYFDRIYNLNRLPLMKIILLVREL